MVNVTEVCWDIIERLINAPISEMKLSSNTKVPSQLLKPSHNKIQELPNYCISDKMIKEILENIGNIFLKEPNKLHVKEPVFVIGDIHGQFNDLIRILDSIGFIKYLKNKINKNKIINSDFDIKETKILFLGDYVDRGPRSTETICLLFSLKILFPKNIFLLRGNHECWYVNKIYGFYKEMATRYNLSLWKKFVEVFNCLPFSAVIGNRIFCCHGGLSPELILKADSIGKIDDIDRPKDVPARGLLCDLLWSDPDDSVDTFGPNSRGTSYTFGKAPLKKFLEYNDFDLVIRAHQVVEEGFEFFCDKKLVTIFSAPNYCNVFNNDAAYMSIDEDLVCRFKMIDKT